MDESVLATQGESCGAMLPSPRARAEASVAKTQAALDDAWFLEMGAWDWAMPLYFAAAAAAMARLALAKRAAGNEDEFKAIAFAALFAVNEVVVSANKLTPALTAAQADLAVTSPNTTAARSAARPRVTPPACATGGARRNHAGRRLG